MVRELRSDHAGETGAVYIYKGIRAVARWRKDAELLAFAHAHGDTEAEHLKLVEEWLPPALRSRLLQPSASLDPGTDVGGASPVATQMWQG